MPKDASIQPFVSRAAARPYFLHPSSASARSTAVRVTSAMERKNQFQNIASSVSHVFLLRAGMTVLKTEKAITCPFASDRCVDVVKVG